MIPLARGINALAFETVPSFASETLPGFVAVCALQHYSSGSNVSSYVIDFRQIRVTSFDRKFERFFPNTWLFVEPYNTGDSSTSVQGFSFVPALSSGGEPQIVTTAWRGSPTSSAFVTSLSVADGSTKWSTEITQISYSSSACTQLLVIGNIVVVSCATDNVLAAVRI